MQENFSYVPENNTTDLPQTSAANKHQHEKETATAGAWVCQRWSSITMSQCYFATRSGSS